MACIMAGAIIQPLQPYGLFPYFISRLRREWRNTRQSRVNLSVEDALSAGEFAGGAGNS